MNAGKVSLLRSQSDARGFIDKTRTLSTIICKKIFHWEERLVTGTDTVRCGDDEQWFR